MGGGYCQHGNVFYSFFFFLGIVAGKKLTHIYTFSSVMSLEYTDGKVITGSGEMCEESSEVV